MTKGAETHAAVLDGALELASTDGLCGITIGALATKVGMSKSGLFAHFESKERLQLAILQHATDRFLELVVTPAFRAPRGEPRVMAIFEHWLAWQHKLPGGCIFAAASIELDDKPGPARDAILRSQKDWMDTLAHAARIAVQEGHFRKSLDVEQFAYEVYCLVLGYFHTARLFRDPKATARVKAALARLVRDARVQN